MSNIEKPKTSPRKKQLCKLCREIVHPGDKVVYEERTFHKFCLNDQQQLNESNSEINKVVSIDFQKDENLDEKKERSKESFENINTDQDSQISETDREIHQETNQDSHQITNLEVDSIQMKLSQNSISDLNDDPSDKFYEVTNDKLSLKSLDDKEFNEEINNDKVMIKVEYCADPTNLNQQDEDSETNHLLKSVSSNLSSLNPFDDDVDENGEEFYKVESADKIQNDNLKSISSGDQINEKNYPKELNPFGSDDEDEIEEINKHELDSMNEELNKSNYPDELNPFDENDETIEEVEHDRKPKKNSNHVIPKNYSTPSLEMFKNKQNLNQTKSSSNLRPKSFNQNYDSLSIRSLTPDGKWRSNKKQQAPKPPSQDSFTVNSSSVNTASNTSSPILNNNKKSNLTIANKTELNYDSSQSLSENENSFVSLTNSDTSESKENIANRRRPKKNKAPPLPSPLIKFVGSIEEIEKECDMIGDNLLVNSNSIREIEIKLKDNHTNKSLSKSTTKKLIYEYLELIETKCSLAKRQAELMYMKCRNKLEKDQIELDSNLRILYNKADKSKTFEGLNTEEDLLEKLIDIIEQKNEVEENIMKIDKSDEFDKSVEKIKEFIDENVFNPILKDFKKNYLNESNLRNNLIADVEIKKRTKKHDKSKGFTLKKLSKLKLSTT